MSATRGFVSGATTRRPLTLHSIGAWGVALAYLVFCISDTMLTLEDERAQLVKIFAFCLLLLAISLRPRLHRLIVLAAPLLFVLWIGLVRSFNADAGMEEFLRFLFPIVITVALFAYRDRIDTVLTVFFVVVLSNDLFQCYFYLAYLTGLPVLLPIRIDSGLFLRAQGWMGFFSEFSFINFCAFLLCRQYKPTERSRALSWLFVLFALLGFSFKMFATLAVYPLIARKVSPRVWLMGGAAAGAALWVIANGYLDSLLNVASAKISFYIVEGNSARAESYRVMFESLAKGNFFGEGLGSFGGPASVKYGSPLYGYYHFNWYGLGSILKTTDTFYPHLFVEIGLLGALVWLGFVLRYGQGQRVGMPWLFVVLAFCFDNIFSMAFVSPSYVFSALLVMHAFSRSGDKVHGSGVVCSRQNFERRR
ncbi:hypothetical protein [Paraburkholderia sp. BL21I4N1]|uniref:hypothetical protein n=1 Tax=Paraburkholderia sp. BL21I4N1 TaxID=1938801 RepID=UPI000CFCBA77|nr:hypothetical protein [Paraburkholderia sp. BL21I4N1]PQV49945.1 hypothetical protein B0G83_106234 [Paraburkholderia sp. BL21I4N1]